MKGKNGKAKAHVVPLVPDILALLRDLPCDGDFLFPTISSISGKQVPISGFSRVKPELDKLMTDDLGRPVEYRLHDLRRSVRTRLSELRVRDDVAESLLAHVQAASGVTPIPSVWSGNCKKQFPLHSWFRCIGLIVLTSYKERAI
jgi:integrase